MAFAATASKRGAFADMNKAAIDRYARRPAGFLQGRRQTLTESSNACRHEGRPANRSLSAIEPVSATAKRKLENGERRPAPETFPARAEIPKITGQRLGSASVTRGNVAGSHTPGNITPETGGRIRTSAWRRTPSEHP